MGSTAPAVATDFGHGVPSPGGSGDEDEECHSPLPLADGYTALFLLGIFRRMKWRKDLVDSEQATLALACSATAGIVRATSRHHPPVDRVVYACTGPGRLPKEPLNAVLKEVDKVPDEQGVRREGLCRATAEVVAVVRLGPGC
jgi:hypothetical protein